MNQYIFNAITDLLKTAVDLNKIGHKLWVEYVPHVNSLDLRLHIGGWKQGMDPDYSKIIYLDEHFCKINTVKKVLKKLKDAKKEINKLCKVKNVTKK